MHLPRRGPTAQHNSYADLLRKLDEGWRIEPPVYVMHNPAQQKQIIFRMVIWRDGKPQVISVRDGADIRQFLADRHLQQEAL